MIDFIKKNKKLLIIILLVLLFIGMGIGVYFIFFNKSDANVDDTDQNVTQEDTTPTEVTPEPTYILKSSKDAMLATYTEARAWASDVKLYECSSLTTTSVQYPDITYYYVGADSGKFAKWFCTYYSRSNAQTMMYEYKEGVIVDSSEPIDIGEFGSLVYDAISYPTNFGTILDSTEIYANAVENGLDVEENYINMYLSDIPTYGYVWRIDERSKTEEDEYGTGLIVNSYVFDIYTGALKIISEEWLY